MTQCFSLSRILLVGFAAVMVWQAIPDAELLVRRLRPGAIRPPLRIVHVRDVPEPLDLVDFPIPIAADRI